MRQCEYCEAYVSDDKLTICEHCGAPLPKVPVIRLVSRTDEEKKADITALQDLSYTRFARAGLILSCIGIGILTSTAVLSLFSGGIPEYFTVISVLGFTPAVIAFVGILLSVVASKKPHSCKNCHAAGIIIGIIAVFLYMVVFAGCTATIGQLENASVLD